MGLHIQQMACGDRHSLVLLSDGSVWGAGDNYCGQLGDGATAQSHNWKSVIPSGGGVIQVATGSEHSLALKSDGSVWATGNNRSGQLGDGTTVNKTTWTCVISSGVIQVAASGHHSLALKADGSVLATGHNSEGQLGDGTTMNKSTWTSVISSGVTQVITGYSYSLALKSNGSVWAVGNNSSGQLGDGTTDTKSMWRSVISSGVTRVTAGYYHSLLLKSDGSVWATGYNGRGQLGNGGMSQCNAWKSMMPGGSDIIQVSAGFRHSLALKSDGSVWATGNNQVGQLGDGAGIDKTTWTSVILSGVTQVAAGHSHSFALKSDGTFWKTGKNDYGQLGHEGDDSLVWMPDRFFERLLLESLLIDPPRPRGKLNLPARSCGS